MAKCYQPEINSTAKTCGQRKDSIFKFARRTAMFMWYLCVCLQFACAVGIFPAELCALVEAEPFPCDLQSTD